MSSPIHSLTRLAALAAAGGLAAAPLAAAPTARKAGAAAKKPRASAPGKPVTGAVKKPPAAAPGPKVDGSLAFFRNGTIPRLKIRIPEPELQKLREQNREYVRCSVVEDGKTPYAEVGIHLKGAAGSFRSVDDRPALTLKFNKFKKGQEFHDVEKIHLNNSVQDPGYLNELICSDLFNAAGIPAPRVTHARVWLNDRDLGFYVLKEGFDSEFIKRHFGEAQGNFYEGGFLQDLDGQPQLKSGKGPEDRSDVQAVVAACREADAIKRWEEVEKRVDIDQFLSFAAMEMLTCHWDGYCRNRNNYRYYFEPKSGKVRFFPAGMDQMFGDPNFNALTFGGTVVGDAVQSNPEWRSRYRKRLSAVLNLLVPPSRVQEQIEVYHKRLRPVLAEMGEGQAADFDNRVEDLKNRVAARAQALTQQAAMPEPKALSFAAGPVTLTGWIAQQESPDARLQKVAPGGIPVLSITSGPGGRCVASWRASVLLPVGKYRFEARARTVSVRGLADDQGTGAGIRISTLRRTNALGGTTGWRPLVFTFSVDRPDQEVELVAELRAISGQAIFDPASLRLVQEK